MGEKDASKFMPGKFKNLLLEIRHNPIKEQKAILDKTFQNWSKGYKQIDDIVVIGAKIS
jgi:hypothetical protein